MKKKKNNPISPKNYISVMLLTCYSCDQSDVWTGFVHLSHYCESHISGRMFKVISLAVIQTTPQIGELVGCWITNTNLGFPLWKQADCTDLLHTCQCSDNFLQELHPSPLEKVCITYIIDMNFIHRGGKHLDGCMEAHSVQVCWGCREVHTKCKGLTPESKIWFLSVVWLMQQKQ